MQIGSLPPRPSPREAGGGRGGEERGRGRGPGRGRRGARKRGETGPRRRRPVRERLGASAARQAASCAPGPRACCCCCCCCCCRCCCYCRRRRRRCRCCCCCRRCPPPACAPAAPASSGRRARPAPRGARPRRRWASAAFRGRAGRPRDARRRKAAFRHRGPSWPPPPPLARPGAPSFSAAAPRARAARCTCSSAGPQPTLGQHSLGETNPSAARRASGRARLAPAAARGSAPPPESQTPASCAVAAASPGPGAFGASAAGAVGPAAEGDPRASRRGFEIGPRRRCRVTLAEVKPETASGIPDDADLRPEVGSRRALAAGRVRCAPSRRGRAGLQAEWRLPPTPNGGFLMCTREINDPSKPPLGSVWQKHLPTDREPVSGTDPMGSD
ncbi:translation initiation factor IF-2-like [Leopardus geoffroyi]|uniref:translation initiation factor IF-2-like n=1 Tax=Leopardus geoffroyi TaxID=46844 RepID=UPI001E26115B|nr:translation initiation factor IF-2-like [Leopardus geoffroyi]